MTTSRPSFLAASTLFLLALLLASCCPQPLSPEVVIGSPFERWDHNRTDSIRTFTYEVASSPFDPSRSVETVELPLLAREAVETPYGERDGNGQWKGLPPRGGRIGGDGLPEAWLRAGFTGVALPLSDVSTSEGWSDRRDLLDFLAAGPHANVGLAPRDLSGGLDEDTERRFHPLLDLLSGEDPLETGARLESFARDRDLRISRSILDPRFLPSAFVDRIALSYGGFWFVLFMPDLEPRRFSRLVVVPDRGVVRDPSQGEPVGAAVGR